MRKYELIAIVFMLRDRSFKILKPSFGGEAVCKLFNFSIFAFKKLCKSTNSNVTSQASYVEESLGILMDDMGRRVVVHGIVEHETNILSEFFNNFVVIRRGIQEAIDSVNVHRMADHIEVVKDS